MLLLLSLFIIGLLGGDGRDIIIPDAKCFEQYIAEVSRYTNELSRETKREFDLQFTSIENTLGITHPDHGYNDTLAISICSLIQPPSEYTLQTYNTANNLHYSKIRTQLINNRIMYRLMMIQKKILEVIPAPTTTPSSS